MHILLCLSCIIRMLFSRSNHLPAKLMHTHSGLLWLPLEKTNKQLLKESDAGFYTQPLDRIDDPSGWVKEKMDEIEEEVNPVGSHVLSINLDPQNFKDILGHQPGSIY